MNDDSSRLVGSKQLVAIACACLALGFLGGILGSRSQSDSNSGSVEPVPMSSMDSYVVDGLKGAAGTTLPTVASTVKPGSILTVPKTIVPQPVVGPPGPAGPAGPAGKDGKGITGVQWIEVGGDFDGCCGEWLASCPSGTLAMTWQLRGSWDAVVNYAGQSWYSNNPNDWMFRANDESTIADFFDSGARFALGCVTIG